MSYPYINNTGRLREFLQKIRNKEIGIPAKLNTKTLPALGFKSSFDRPIIKILKFIDFLNSDGTPTEHITIFRTSEYGKVMARNLKEAYADLFELYTDAQKRSIEELIDFFSTKTTAGKQVLNYTVSTFNVLCEFAEFEALSDVEVPPAAEEITVTVKKPPIDPGISQFPLNINVEIKLPITENVEVYDKIFEALRRHLIDKTKETS